MKDNTDYKIIGNRIRSRRNQLHMTQQQVNELSGVNERYLSNIENAKSKMSIGALLNITKALQTTPDYILLGSMKESENSHFTEILENKLKLLEDRDKLFLLTLIEWYLDSHFRIK